MVYLFRMEGLPSLSTVWNSHKEGNEDAAYVPVEPVCGNIADGGGERFHGHRMDAQGKPDQQQSKIPMSKIPK